MKINFTESQKNRITLRRVLTNRNAARSDAVTYSSTLWTISHGALFRDIPPWRGGDPVQLSKNGGKFNAHLRFSAICGMRSAIPLPESRTPMETALPHKSYFKLHIWISNITRPSTWCVSRARPNNRVPGGVCSQRKRNSNENNVNRLRALFRSSIRTVEWNRLNLILGIGFLPPKFWAISTFFQVYCLDRPTNPRYYARWTPKWHIFRASP